MTYYVYALENTKARLLAYKLETNDKEVAEYAADKYKACGYIVSVGVEQ